MRTVRRLYFYSLSLISAEVVIWGVINLIRTIVSNGLVGGGSLLATGLSLVLVGLPIFWLHWRTVQRDASGDFEERASRIRAVFLYAVLFAVMLPILSSILALLDRGFLSLLGVPADRAWIGGDQTAWDNIIAILVNTVALAYFWNILRADWQANTPENYLADARRLFRYVWVVIGLTLMVSGVFNLLRYVLYTPGQNAQQTAPTLAGGLALILVGTPLWLFYWRTVQSSLRDPSEQRSLLRLVVLYLISLAGVIGVLASAGRVLNSLIRWVLGDSQTLITFLQGNSAEIGAAIPLAVMWAYYGRILNDEVARMPDQPRREALRRLYNYILSLLGLAVTFSGLISLVEYLSQLLFTRASLVGSFRGQISGAISALIVGLPLWMITWRKMQHEAARLDDAGDHARRSVLRKSYLYLVLFLLVIGAMTFTAQLLYALLNAVLSGANQDLAYETSRLFLSLVIDVSFLVYHWRALREDGRLAQQTLGSLHAAFPTLVLTEEMGSPSAVFGSAFVQALERSAARLPVAVHSVELGAPDETMFGAKVILLPVGLALNPPESLRLWLAEYKGQRILVPLPAEKWAWLGAVDKRPNDMAREAAQMIRQMAEGELVRQVLTNNPWSIAGYILGGLFGLIVISLLFSLLVSSLFRQ